MSDELQLTRIVAPHALTCFQCVNIGLPVDGIAEGDTCVEIAMGKNISFACEDCFERLNLEIEAMASGEDEVDELEE